MSPTPPIPHRKNMRTHPTSRGISLNAVLLFITVIVGIVAWVIGINIYSFEANIIAMPLLIGIIFLILYLF